MAHRCPCGVDVDTRGLHGLSCRSSYGRGARHHQLNDVVYRALRRADIPATKEPTGLLRTDNKRPDGLTLVPWREGRCLTWDATVVDTFATSYLGYTTALAGGAAEEASRRKEVKYARIAETHLFTAVAVETMGPIGQAATAFLSELGRRLTAITGDQRDTGYSFQRVIGHGTTI